MISVSDTERMSHWGKDVLQALRLRRGYTQETFAAALGRTVNSIAKHEGKRAFSDSPQWHAKDLAKVAEILSVTPDVISGAAPLPPAQVYNDKRPYVRADGDASRADPQAIGHTIPLHTRTSAGPTSDYQRGIYADRYLPSALIPFPEWGLGAFMVEGDSMLPYFQPGDILFIAERLQEVQTGDILIVGFQNGEHTVKKLRVIDDETWELVPINPNVETRRVKRSDVAWYVPVVGRFEPIWRRRTPQWEL